MHSHKKRARISHNGTYIRSTLSANPSSRRLSSFFFRFFMLRSILYSPDVMLFLSFIPISVLHFVLPHDELRSSYLLFLSLRTGRRVAGERNVMTTQPFEVFYDFVLQDLLSRPLPLSLSLVSSHFFL